MRDKYEISLWDDIYSSELGRFVEDKIAIIGSDTMEAQWKAIEPSLVTNINGVNTFTFKVYKSYIDTVTGEKIDNPFIKEYLINERKVKVFWKNKWYDFYIKNISETSDNKGCVYTCQDAYITELSKNGFNLQFDGELKNNIDTAPNLVKTTLEGTDWSLKNEDVVLKEWREEPVYEAIALADYEAISKDQNVLIYYSNVSDYITQTELNVSKDVWIATNKESGPFKTIVNSQLVDKDTINCFSLPLTIKIEKDEITQADAFVFYADEEKLFKIYPNNISANYRAEKLIASQIYAEDEVLGKSVLEYEYNGKKLYGYAANTVDDCTTVVNLIANSKLTSGMTGWQGKNLSQAIYPTFNDKTDITNYKTHNYLIFTADNWYLNRGVKENKSFIPNGFQIGDKFICRVKGYTDEAHSVYLKSNESNVFYCDYTVQTDEEGTTYVPEETNYFDVTLKSFDEETGWITYLLTCKQTLLNANIGVTNNQGKDNGLLFSTTVNSFIEEVEFFELKEDNEGNIIYPNDYTIIGGSNTKYYYYEKDNDWLKPEDYVYTYVGLTPLEGATPVYKNNFEKVRTITIGESNRFNILQTIAETFECWLEFEIEHDAQGRVVYDENNIPKKYVIIKENKGIDNGLSFVYGIDLKQIQRNIISDTIVTKTIVSPNSNEFAENKSCNIAHSIDNYPKVGFILNFDYFISHGLLDANTLNRDLYSNIPEDGYVGYYFNLNRLNTEYDNNTDKLSELNLLYVTTKARDEVVKNQLASLQSQKIKYEDEIMGIAGTDSLAAAIEACNSQFATDNMQALASAYGQLISDSAEIEKDVENLDNAVASLKTEIDDIVDRQENIEDELKSLDKAFFTKYSRYLQEGTWISEDYIDDNLYYYDALSVAYTSARPKVEYTISVLRLSSLEEFKNKIFNVGDIGYIEDTEFFGYVKKNNIKTPYKEQIVISEVTSYFDNPDRDVIKVQNFKTQFEDLFQRIAAATQSLQFSEGSYNNAANALSSNGLIQSDLLTQSLAAATESFSITSSDQKVLVDSTGVTVYDVNNPGRLVKMTSGGIACSIDGGLTWTAAVTPSGVNVGALQSGAINTRDIQIYSGDKSTFRWNERGLSAYNWKYSDNGEDIGVNIENYVRFDKYGIYGINGISDFLPTSEDEYGDSNSVWHNANFALTWKGFLLKTNDGSVRITSQDDIGVYDRANTTRVKIGRIGFKTTENQWLPNTNYEVGDLVALTYQNVYQTFSCIEEHTSESSFDIAYWSPAYIYGISIKNAQNENVMDTDDNGDLWLKSSLKVGNGISSMVGIGYGTKVRTDTEYHEIINANDNFIVYEDGYVRAVNGEFVGSISADNGSIGGFTIDSSGIKSPNNDIQLLSEGLIKAKNINLGEGAVIDNYIALGNNDAWIYNPVGEAAGDEHLFLRTDNFSLNKDGLMKLGNITLDGENSRIYGDSFSITPTLSNFTNVNISGKLSTFIMETNKVNAAGGSMIFKESYKIENQISAEGKLTINLDSPMNLNSAEIVDENWKHYGYLINESGETTEVLKITSLSTDKRTFVVETNSTEKFNIFVDLGRKDTTIMGINGGDSDAAFIKPHSITMSKLIINNDNAVISNTPSLILGELSGLNNILGVNYDGYGLYADNVFLNGTLTTRNQGSNTFAGVNTLSETYYNRQGNTDEPIIFWAGANANTPEAIQNSPFQVTAKGTLYAQKGLFEGSIISKATISASAIYASGFYGGSTEDSQALRLYDLTQGIQFMDSRGENASPTLILNKDAFSYNNNSFVTFDNNNVNFIGKSIKLGNDSSYLTLESGKIDFINEQDGETTSVASLNMNNNDVTLVKGTNSFKINESNNEITGNTIFNNNLSLRENMRYEYENQGYNLYIS